MKIVFLHIGDMHIKDRNGVNFFQINKIADTLNSLPSFDRIVLIIAGDIAQSGTADQYTRAGHLIGELITAIKRKLAYTQKIDVLCVPGNHDMDHKGKPMSSDDLQKIRKVNSYDKHLPNELDKQKAFFVFSTRNSCFEDKSVFCRRMLTYDGFKIEANLINTGIFSIIEEDKALHYLPQYALNDISTPTGAQFVITIMHHAPEWYTDAQKNIIEETIYGKSSIVFYGHEHFIGKKMVSYEASAPAVIQAGGCLCVNEDWSESAFHIGELNTETLEYNHAEYKWNSKQKQYEPIANITNILPYKPSLEKGLYLTETFQEELLHDGKHDISTDFRDYYVFPRIQSDDNISGRSHEFTTEDSFIDEILKKKKVLISGGYNSGKSTLLHKLFLHLYDMGYAVLLCDTESIRGKKADRIIRNCFADIYGENASDFQRYEQFPIEKRVLIVDDIDQIKPNSFDYFMSQIGEKFEYLIFSSKQMIDLDLFERMKTQLKAIDSVYRYKILPMYSDKRNELIQRIVSLKSTDSTTVNKTSQKLSDAINAQRRFISLDPDFIIKYVEYYCNNLGDAAGGDSGVFSKVFEASLINSISKYQTARLSVDKTFVLLSKVAHYIHFHKAYPISEHQVMSIVEQYNTDYGAAVNGTDFISIVTQAKILVFDEISSGYRFGNKNYLAYYVAREVNSRYNDTNDDSDLQSLLRCACFGINADILLFISYITDNIRILRLILNMAEEYTKSWPEFNFRENTPKFLCEERRHTVNTPPPDAKKREEAAVIQNEKAAEQAVQTVEIYDYSEDDVDSFVNQLLRALQLLTIVARCLPNFEHNMPKADKEAFVKAIYILPNKAFFLWANETDKEVEEIIAFFKEQSQDYYARQKKLTDDDIIRALQWTSMSFLLDLYNLSVIYATKDSTISHLSSFDYLTNDTYQLEHLMMLERQASADAFITEAKKMFKKQKNFLTPIMVKRIVNHALVHRKDLNHSQIQQLESTFFKAVETQRWLLVERSRNKNKGNE